jgi:hypothetical protein
LGTWTNLDMNTWNRPNGELGEGLGPVAIHPYSTPGKDSAPNALATLLASLARCRVSSTCFGFELAGQLFVGQATTNNLLHGFCETLAVRHLAIVVAESLLIYVAEQVVWLHAHIGSPN